MSQKKLEINFDPNCKDSSPYSSSFKNYFEFQAEGDAPTQSLRICTSLVTSEYSLKQNIVREVFLMRYGHPDFYKFGKYLVAETVADKFAQAAVLACKESLKDSFIDASGSLVESKRKIFRDATEICANHLTRYRSPVRQEFPLDVWLRLRRQVVGKHMNSFELLEHKSFQTDLFGYENSP